MTTQLTAATTYVVANVSCLSELSHNFNLYVIPLNFVEIEQITNVGNYGTNSITPLTYLSRAISFAFYNPFKRYHMSCFKNNSRRGFYESAYILFKAVFRFAGEK